jgi:hypothetical protein
LGFYTVLVVVALSAQAAPPTVPLAGLSGRWVTIRTPPRGEAPIVPPSFVVETKEHEVRVSIQGESHVATVFGVSGEEMLLLVRPPATPRGTRTLIIRPTGPDEVRLETYMEYPQQSTRRSNFYYAETFKRVR